jgi:hypothetical protein
MYVLEERQAAGSVALTGGDPSERVRRPQSGGVSEGVQTLRLHMRAALLPMLLSAALPAQAQTAQELVAKNQAARGGVEKLAAMRSLVTKGELRFPGDFKLAYTETRSCSGPANCSDRVEASLQGLTLVQAFDGRTGWRINPFEGRKDAAQMGADEARSLADEGIIEGALLTASARGSKVDYLGREDIDGTLTYKLRVSQRDGTVYTYYLDPDVFLEIKVIERRTIRGSEQETETDLADYELVNGAYFPFSITSGPRNSPDKQVITIDSGQANVPIDPGLFAMPGTAARPK